MNALGLSMLLMPDEMLPVFAVLLFAMACLAFEPLITDLVGVFISATPRWLLALLVVFLILKVTGRFFRDVAVHVAGDLTSELIRRTLTTRYGLSMLAKLIAGGMLWVRFG